MARKFSRMTINNWRQFENLDIAFHDRLTVVTGGNGAGKSTVLRLLAQHFGWNTFILATPQIGNTGGLTYSSGLWDLPAPTIQPQGVIIGEITYSSGETSKLRVPSVGGVQYNVAIDGQQQIQGVHIASHRLVGGYQRIANIPVNALGAQQAYTSYFSETIQRHNNANTPYTPVYRMKEAIISMATFGPGNQYVQRNEAVLNVFEGFKKVLSKLLPKSIGFKDISVRIPDVVIVTDSGDFIIDASSGGIMSLIDLAWQIYLYSQDKGEFVVVLDEPENHLHPTMQRSILSNLIDSFPNAQFIVATHSPFIVSSVKDSYVYVLRYDIAREVSDSGIKNSVRSLRLDNANKAGTASEILRDVLGVPVTMPEWVEEEVKAIAADFEINTLNTENLSELRGRLAAAGLGEFYPDALKQIVSDHD